jgi:oligo-1,6-glucosidase
MPTLNEYQHQKNIGGNMAKFMADIKFGCRDNGRTPMQWDSSMNAGFSSGHPWLKVSSNYKFVNVAAEENDPNSCLNYFRKMAGLRKENKALIYGKYTLLDKANPDVYAYTRELNGEKLLVLLNFHNKTATVHSDINLGKAKLLIGNYPGHATGLELKPYEAVIYKL